MQRGYIKLWRKSIDSGMFQKPELWTFWCWCLIKASHKEHKCVVGYQEVELQPGQFIFGRNSASAELHMSVRTIRTCLQHLEKSQKVTIKSTNKYSIISIINWELYQSPENENDQQPDQQATSKRPASDHKQECNNGKNGKDNSHLLELSRKFMEYQQRAFPNALKEITDKKVKEGAETLRKLIEIDRHDLEKEIRPVLHWLVRDEFWCDKVLSTASLRKKGENGNTKFVNAMMSMNGNKNKKPTASAERDPEWY